MISDSFWLGFVSSSVSWLTWVFISWLAGNFQTFSRMTWMACVVIGVLMGVVGGLTAALMCG